MVVEQRHSHLYGTGEEVVFRPGDGYVLQQQGAAAAVERLPSWTIGAVIGQASEDGTPAYDIEFRMLCDVYVCRVPECAIEGTA